MDEPEAELGSWGAAEPLRLLAVALQFLTRVPVGAVEVRGGDLTRASAVFPLVGALVAGVGVAVRAGAEPLWGPAASTALSVLAMVVVTGAFHEDGLADACDGLWGGREPEERLTIMRDSRLGTYGTTALLSSLALQVSLLSPLGLALRRWAPVAVLVGVVVVAGWRAVLVRKLGGVNGDTLGAAVQLVLLSVVGLVSALAQVGAL